MDTQLLCSQIQSLTDNELAELYALLKKNDNRLIEIVKADTTAINPDTSGDPPPGSTYPPAP